MANVFMSYRQIDTEPAEKLASEVAHAGHQVWFAEWKICDRNTTCTIQRQKSITYCINGSPSKPPSTQMVVKRDTCLQDCLTRLRTSEIHIEHGSDCWGMLYSCCSLSAVYYLFTAYTERAFLPFL